MKKQKHCRYCLYLLKEESVSGRSPRRLSRHRLRFFSDAAAAAKIVAAVLVRSAPAFPRLRSPPAPSHPAGRLCHLACASGILPFSLIGEARPLSEMTIFRSFILLALSLSHSESALQRRPLVLFDRLTVCLLLCVPNRKSKHDEKHTGSEQ